VSLHVGQFGHYHGLVSVGCLNVEMQYTMVVLKFDLIDYNLLRSDSPPIGLGGLTNVERNTVESAVYQSL
jgi:hypothetical protein